MELKFCGIPVKADPFGSGASVLAGSCHDAYREFASDTGRYEFRSYDRPVIETVRPNLIEGIRLNPDEIADPSRFWSQHKAGGTMETFRAIAGLVPGLRETHVPGKTYGDPDMTACANIYLSTGRPDVVSLYRGPGFYWFQTNGRHRVIAARLADVPIPARIVGDIILK